MSTQTEAERLADELYSDRWITHGPQWGYDAAAELRRLESANTELQAEILEQCRINGMGAEREDALRAEVDRLNKAQKWVGLTDEEIEQGCKESWVTEQAWQSAVWWAEEKLKEKNNA